jgi:hypothetical protein
MSSNWLIVPLILIAEAWSMRRDAKIRFLQLQIELYKGKLPCNRVILAPEERKRLLRLGEQIGHRIDDLIGIVNVKTYRRWLREQQGGREPGRVGRPRHRPSVPPTRCTVSFEIARQHPNGLLVYLGPRDHHILSF